MSPQLEKVGNINKPTAIVIFGGTGDLAQTKLLPALFHLYIRGALPKSFVIVGLSRKQLSDTDYQQFVKNSLGKMNHSHDANTIDDFCENLRYVSGAFDNEVSYEDVKSVLASFDDSLGQCTNKLFYLAVPPEYYEVIFTHLHNSQTMALCDGEDSWSRLLVEKPFGKDLKTALDLEKQLCSLFTDEQIYRIDHYLAKDSIENIMSLRFANSILADSWNKDRIESISVNLFETKDVSNRGSFYDGLGTLRDVGQNHLLQTLALLIMEAPDMRDASSVRTARTKALELLLTESPDKIIRAQYKGFLDTVGVQADSQTETYFKISVLPEASLWQGVRLTLEAGKAMDRSINEATIVFKPLHECRCSFSAESHFHQNILKIRFSPDQDMSLTLWTKKTGFDFELEPRELELLHATSTDIHSPEAYERVLFDCISGDQTRFVSSAEVGASWGFITPILESFSSVPLHQYDSGANEKEIA